MLFVFVVVVVVPLELGELGGLLFAGDCDARFVTGYFYERPDRRTGRYSVPVKLMIDWQSPPPPPVFIFDLDDLERFLFR